MCSATHSKAFFDDKNLLLRPIVVHRPTLRAGSAETVTEVPFRRTCSADRRTNDRVKEKGFVQLLPPKAERHQDFPGVRRWHGWRHVGTKLVHNLFADGTNHRTELAPLLEFGYPDIENFTKLTNRFTSHVCAQITLHSKSVNRTCTNSFDI